MIRCHCYPDPNDPRQGTGCGGCMSPKARRRQRGSTETWVIVAALYVVLAALLLFTLPGCAYVHHDRYTGVTAGALGEAALAYHCVGAQDPETGQVVRLDVPQLESAIAKELGVDALRQVRLSALPSGGVCYVARGSKISDAVRDVILYAIAKGGLGVLSDVVGVGSDAVNKP